MLKKFTFLTLVLGLSFVLSGCSLYGNQPAAQNNTNVPAQPQADVNSQPAPTVPNNANVPAQPQQKVVTPANKSVIIANFTFSPTNLNIIVGDTVTWHNSDPMNHSIVADGVFQSQPLNSGQDFSYTFTTAGDFPYHCGIHPTMTGRITVK